MQCVDPGFRSSHHRAQSDHASIFGFDVPAPYQLIERLMTLRFRARGCRHYLRYFLENDLITLGEADLVLAEIAPEHWQCRRFPRSWIVSSHYSVMVMR